MSISVIFLRLFLIVAMILVGFIAKIAKVLSKESLKAINAIAFNIALPMLIVSSIYSNFSKENIGKMGLTILIAVCIYSFSIGLSYIYVKPLKLNQKTAGVHQYALAFTNVAFVGVPIIKAFFPPEAMLYGSVFVTFFSLLNHSIGAIMLSGDSNRKTADILKSPPIVGAIIGLLFAVSGIKISGEIMSFVTTFGNMTTPLAMLSIGITIAYISPKELFGDWKVYLTCFLRLLVIPLLIMIVLKNIFRDNFLLWAVPTVVAAMPAPSTLPILSDRYGADQEAAGKIMALSTLLAVITIPVFSILIF